MDSLISLLLTSEPKVLPYSPSFLQECDPIPWAAILCRKHATSGLRLQAMKSAVDGGQQEDNAIYTVDTRDIKTVENVLGAIMKGQAGHANMELLHCNSLNQTSRFGPGLHFYYHTFYDALEQRYPHGHYTKANLWFSASRHVYAAHTDMADGFLFQLKGRKHVKVWPVPNECANEVLYDHRDLVYRQSLPCHEFDLGPGEMLFIPGSAVHEVTVDSGYSSVSVGFHVGGPYSLLTLRRDLEEMFTEQQFSLPDRYCHIKKPHITFFQPGRYYASDQKINQGMPTILRDTLSQAIATNDSNKNSLGTQLDLWWQEKMRRPTYPGPYPQETYDGIAKNS